MLTLSIYISKLFISSWSSIHDTVSAILQLVNDNVLSFVDHLTVHVSSALRIRLPCTNFQ
jgi:hypothetical protein